jgi:hypothetical protein
MWRRIAAPSSGLRDGIVGTYRKIDNEYRINTLNGTRRGTADVDIAHHSEWNLFLASGPAP